MSSTSRKIAPPGIARRLPGRPTRQAALELREIFVQMALDTFLAKGYAGASIESIADAARASKVTIYRQFGNKENLFRAALNLAQQKARSKFQSLVELDGDPEVVLKRIILGLHAGFTTPEYLAMTRLMIAESQRFPEVRQA